jgi:hypothetical protein
MKKKFNYTIAYKRRDKGFKACYRYTKHDSCVYDSSYNNYLFIKLEDGKNAGNIFKDILKTFTIDDVISDKKMEFFKSYNLNFYNTINGRFIGPVNLIVINSMIIIKFHPLMKNEIVENFKVFLEQRKNLQNNESNQKMNLDEQIFFNNLTSNLTLIGPRSGSVLYKIIKSLTFSEDNNLNNLLESINEEEFEKELHYLKDNKVIIFRLRKPTSHFKMNEFIFNKITNQILSKNDLDNVEMKSNFIDSISEINEKNSHEKLGENLFSIFNLKSHNIEENVPSIIINRERKLEIEIPTERTVFQHRKKVNLESLNKKLKESLKKGANNNSINNNIIIQTKKSSHLKDKAEKEQMKIELNLNQNTVSKEELKNITSSSEETFFILIKQNVVNSADHQSQPIYNLIFPQGYSIDLLRRFVYLQCRAIGLSELNFYLTETKNLIFPNDYPSTLSYQNLIKEKALRKIEKYCKYPASKRVNYQKIGNPSPFYPAWAKLKSKLPEEKKLEFMNFNENLEIVNDLINKSKIMSQFKIQKISQPSLKNFIIPISINMTGKGIPRYNSLICMPTENDIINYIRKKEAKINSQNYLEKIMGLDTENINKSNSHSNRIKLLDQVYHSRKEKIIEPVQKVEIKNKIFNIEFNTLKSLKKEFTDDSGLVNYSTNILENDLTIKLPINNYRKIIGYVTTGQFSYSQSKGVGRGYISLNYYEALVNFKNEFKTEDLILLVRHKNSRVYYPAKIELLSI